MSPISEKFSHCYKEKTKIVNAYHHPQVIISPYYPFEVAPNVHCRWLIKAPPGHKVILDVKDINMKGSNDCNNFGLYVYDGKTNYDDERVGKLCDRETGMRSFTSSSVYLMVEFTSGPHVLLSGGGVKLSFRSSHGDEETNKDHSLLFILIGVLLGVASYTVLMIILRYVVVPARRKHSSRAFGPDRSASLTPLRSISITSSISDPPPPYRATEDAHHTTKRGVIGALSCHLANIFKPARAPAAATGGAANPAFGALTNGQYPTPDNYSSFIPHGAREPTQEISMTTLLANEYRQLPQVPQAPHDGPSESAHLYDTLSNAGSYVSGGSYAGCYQQPVQSTESDAHAGDFGNNIRRNDSVSASARYESYTVCDVDRTTEDTETAVVGYADTTSNDLSVASHEGGGGDMIQVQMDFIERTDVEGREGYQLTSTAGPGDGPRTSVVRAEGRRRVDDDGYEIPSCHYDLPDEIDVPSNVLHL
ncbi:hypothetical protein Btru_029625 [Bulinus truncatus]|nr:hypothetical protein Btru_029625 [Bulinus truncatus]